MAWVFTYGAVAFLPIGARSLVVEIPLLTPRGWIFLGYILAMPTIVAYYLNAWALARSSATVVTIYIYLQPLIAALLAWVQLGHGISPRAAIAAVLILAGLGVVTARRAGSASRAPR
jgi:drug/metabolite transporter (DMT)-like permease